MNNQYKQNNYHNCCNKQKNQQYFCIVENKCNCNCTCSSLCNNNQLELILNGDMEQIENDKPKYWNFEDCNKVNSINYPERVHSNKYSVNIKGTTYIEQIIPIKKKCCNYLLSFFAKSYEDNISLKVTIDFITPNKIINGNTLIIRNCDLNSQNTSFSYYKLLSSKSPCQATNIRIRFQTYAEDNQSLDLDDVSLIQI